MVLALAGTVAAQTGPGLMLVPWKGEQQRVEVRSSNTLLIDSEIEGGTDTDLNYFDASARFRLDPAGERQFTVGLDMTSIDFGDDLFTDQSIALGLGVGQTDDWDFAVTAGIGYASDNAYEDGRAVYGKGSLIASTKFDADSGLTLVLDYDANRPIFPDVPLPGVQYWRRVDDTLRYAVGLPQSSVSWSPMDKLRLEVRYLIPLSFSARVALQVHEALEVFAGFEGRTDAFFLTERSKLRRAIFTQRTAELGVTWRPCEWFDLTAAGGYAFGQEMEVGFDIRSGTGMDFDDTPFVRVGASLRF